MHRSFILLFALLPLLFAQSSDSLVDRAVELYLTRHQNFENLFKSRDILKEVVNSEPGNVRALYELSRVFYLLGDAAETKEEKLELYNKGKEYGEKAIKADDDSAWAHFWYMVNLGRIGQTKGVLNSLALVPEIKKEIDRVLKLDSEHTGAFDARAMLYYELPWLLGGNLNKSIEALNRGLEIDSNYTVLYIDMAKVYIKKKNYEKARWYLNKVLQITTPTYEADYVLIHKPEAKRLLKEIEEKEK